VLHVRDLHAGYGNRQVLHGVAFELRPGEIVALLGRNGSGRSTTARAIMGLVPARGTIQWQGRELCGASPFEIARAGIGYVPESRDIFPTLTVQQNLMLGRQRHRTLPRRTLPDFFARFPALHERRHVAAGALSGGEQQMLALCRTLMGDPQLLLVDEPTEGLAPLLVEQIGALLRELQQRGVAVLLIEQKLHLALAVAGRCLVMGHGCIVYQGPPDSLHARADVRREWLEV